MGTDGDANSFDALHVELCSAITDLAKSVDVAVSRIALRARCNAAIVDAAKAERAADVLRKAVSQPTEHAGEGEVTLVPGVLPTRIEVPKDNSASDIQEWEAMDELFAACNWLSKKQGTRQESKGPRFGDSIIATRILELQDRLGGLIKG